MKERNQRGSVTIEATIALTAFLFMFMMLYSVVTICRAETKITMAVNNAAKEISQYSYIYSLTGLNGSEAAINEGAQGTKDKINEAVNNVADTFDAIQTLRSDGENMVKTVSSAEENVENAVNNDLTTRDNIASQQTNTSPELEEAYNKIEDQAGQITTDAESVLSSGKEVQKSLEAMAENPKELMFGLAKILATQTMDVAKSRLIAEPVSRALVKKNLKRSPSDNAEACLQALGVVPGKDFFGKVSYVHGLDFSHSLLFPKGQEDIIIIVKYKLRLFQYLPLKIEFDITQTAATMGWFNGDGADKASDSTGGGATPNPSVTVTPTPVETTEGEKNAKAIADLTEKEKTELLDKLRKQYDDIDDIYKYYGIEALYLIDKYKDDAYLLISEHGADSIRVIRNYGTESIKVLIDNEADFLETVEMINQYGKAAIDIISKYKKDGLYVLYVYGDELTKLDASKRAAFIKDKVGSKNTQELLKESSCSPDEIYNYLLKNVDAKTAELYKKTGNWPEDIQIPKSPDVLKPDGSIDWSKAKEGGYTLKSDGTADKVQYAPNVTEVIDRYGNSDGRYTSPVINGKPYSYEQRSLPYVEDESNYHQYEVKGDFSKLEEYVKNCKDTKLKTAIENDIEYYYNGDYSKAVVYKGKIAEVDGWGTGGGIQYEFPIRIEYLVELGMLKEIK